MTGMGRHIATDHKDNHWRAPTIRVSHVASTVLVLGAEKLCAHPFIVLTVG
jgi:hypothetical protein